MNPANKVTYPRQHYLIFIPLLIGLALLFYKTNTSLRVLRSAWDSGSIASRPEVVAFGQQVSATGVLERSANYLLVVWPALVFGILIGAGVRAFVSPDWFARLTKGRLVTTQVAAGLAGAPLMLCSCCVAPIFASVAHVSSRLGPALGLMLASPALNPAALALTFILFEPEIGTARIILSATAVLLIGPIVEWMFQGVSLNVPAKATPAASEERRPVMQFLESVITISIWTLPGLIVGLVASMLIVQSLPAGTFVSPGAQIAAIVLAATIAIPLALPTFLEIPLALSLLAAGFPAGAAVALLFAGPIINLPSLFSVARAGGWKPAAVVALLVWILSITGGLLMG
jgi:uncharacterized membrane protein YraQ (UPF0718 family)